MGASCCRSRSGGPEPRAAGSPAQRPGAAAQTAAAPLSGAAGEDSDVAGPGPNRFLIPVQLMTLSLAKAI